jgi:hypothetical protein
LKETPVSHVRILDVSCLLTAANIPHDRYDGACGTPDCIEFRPLDSDGTETLRFDDLHGWVLDSQTELSEGILGPIHTVKLANPEATALGVAAAVEGVYRGLVDEFEAVR